MLEFESWERKIISNTTGKDVKCVMYIGKSGIKERIMGEIYVGRKMLRKEKWA